MDGQSKSSSIPLTAQHEVSVPQSGSGWEMRYKKLEDLGRGACAEVFRALDTRRNDVVAVKVPNESTEELRRFSREVNQLKRLSHDNVIEILDAGERWYTMPVAEGNLTSLAAELCDEERIEAVAQVARGLAAVHRDGLVHRDVSPNNILRIGTRWVVSDFGFVKKPEGMSSDPKTEGIFGTRGYVAPEVQALGSHSATVHSDMYSLGKVVLYITTNHWPGNGNPPEVPRIWESLIGKMTDTAVWKRFQSMDELQPALLEVWRKLKEQRRAEWASGRSVSQELRTPERFVLAMIINMTPDNFHEEEIRNSTQVRDRSKLHIGLIALKRRGFVENNCLDDGRVWGLRLTEAAQEWYVANADFVNEFQQNEPDIPLPSDDDNIPF